MKRIIKLILKSQLFAIMAGVKFVHGAGSNVLDRAENYWKDKLYKATDRYFSYKEKTK